LETQIYDNEERAYEELHEQYELNDALASAAHDHSRTTLQTISDFLSVQREYLTQSTADNSLEKSDRIIAALATLETCLYYANDQLSADLRQYTQQRLSDLTELFEIDIEKLITINDVSQRRLPASAATPLAVFISEALENALQHAFDNEDPVRYLQISLTEKAEEHPLETNYSLTISDSGSGIPGNIDPTNRETLGFAIMYDMADKLSAQLKFSNDEGTRIELTFSLYSEH
jgi:two-component sensor histidine kinase